MLPVASEIPLLSLFPYLFDEAENSGRSSIGRLRSFSGVKRLRGRFRFLAVVVAVVRSCRRRAAFESRRVRCERFARSTLRKKAYRICGSTRRDPIRRHCQVGSLTGAVHLSKNNAGVLRPAQRGQKPRVEQKGKSWLDSDVQYASGLRKQGLSILLASRA